MTIYILDEDLTKSAQYLDDKSLDRQIKDIAQVLCNVHHANIPCMRKTWDANIPLKPKWPNKFASALLDNKWTNWANTCRANYLWMVEYGIVGSKNKYTAAIYWARDNVPDLPIIGMPDEEYQEVGYRTPFPLFMPNKYFKIYPYKMLNIIESYRNYYQSKLPKDAKWTNREKPEWLNFEGKK